MAKTQTSVTKVKVIKKDIFARIIELPNHQVLVKKGYDPDKDECYVTVTSMVKDVEATVKMGFGLDEVKQMKAFNTYDEKAAKGFIKTASSLLK